MLKEFLTYQQQIEKLRSSGLRIEDEEVCRRVLADIGYFPVVNGYQSFFRDPSTRVYREGATFGDILALYEFDVELREIMLEHCSRSRRRSGRRWPTSSALLMASPRASI